MKSVANYFQHLLIDDHRKWYPLLSVYYLTYDCRFRCPYCSDGSGVPYYTLKSPEISVDRAYEIIKTIRRHCENIVITGGEPLLYRDLNPLLLAIKQLRFRCVVLTTNGYDLAHVLDGIASSVHDLVFSIDTLDHQKADAMYGAGDGALAVILKNIETAARTRPRRYQITISSVVTPSNIEDLYAVYDFSKQNGFCFAACPQLVGVFAHEALVSDPGYRRFYDHLISEKKKGYPVFGTVPYLAHLRDLKKFDCRPFTMLVVSPEGNVFYPCLEIGKNAGNILEENSLHRIRENGFNRFGPQPRCGNQCHSACALSFSLLLKHPASVFGEIYRMGKGALR